MPPAARQDSVRCFCPQACSGLEETEALSPGAPGQVVQDTMWGSPLRPILSQVLGRASAPPAFLPTRRAAEQLPGRLGPKDSSFLAVFLVSLQFAFPGAEPRLDVPQAPQTNKQPVSPSRPLSGSHHPQEKGVSLTNLVPEPVSLAQLTQQPPDTSPGLPSCPGDPLFTQGLEWHFQSIDQIRFPPLTLCGAFKC